MERARLDSGAMNKPDYEFDKVVDLHVSEWKRRGRFRLPFTLFDVKIWVAMILVYVVVGVVVSTAVGSLRNWLDPPDWPPKWAREP